MLIGRHDVQLSEIAAITPRGWLISLLSPGFNVHLKSGVTLHFTPEEKAKFDSECEIEKTVRQMYDVARGSGLKAFA